MSLCPLLFYVDLNLRPVFLLCTLALALSGGFVSAYGQVPAITSFSPASICQGGTVTITGSGFNGTTGVKFGSVNASSFNVNSDTEITAVVANNALTGTVTVTTPGGTGTAPGNLTILQAPIPVLHDISTVDAAFTNCNGNNSYTLIVRNNSSNTTATDVYTINWGDNSTSFTQTGWSPGAQTSHTYNSQGYFSVVFTIASLNGCTKSVTYNFYNGKNPLASLTTTNSTTGLCAPAAVEFQVGNWYNNSAGTTYQLNFGDGSPSVTLAHPLNGSNTLHFQSHNYTTSSCPSPDFKATLKAINGCFTTTYTLDQIIIRKKPTANFTAPSAAACLNTPICFTNTTINGYSGNSCNTSTSYVWDFGDNTTSTEANPNCHTYTAPGTYTVTLTASNASCGSDIKVRQVVVLPASLPPTLSASPVTYCQGDVPVPLTATGSNLLWYTSATGGTGSPNAPTPPTAAAQTLTYYVSQTTNGNCESPRVPLIVSIVPRPPKPGLITPVQLCQNATASPLTATGTNLLWYTAATGGTGSSTAPTPSTASLGTTTYYVSQTTGSCESQRAAIVVTVNAQAAAPVVSSPVTYCQNQAATVLTATGTGLVWYTAATGGTGSTNAPTPLTTIVGTTNYYVSQVTGCGEGPRAQITVIVNAGPSAAISYPVTSLCNVQNTSANPNPPIDVVQTGTPGGTYSVSPSTGLSISTSTGTITPSGAAPGTYTITYTIQNTGGCATFTTTATVNINGTPAATLNYPASVCTSTNTVSPQLTGSGGGTYASTAGLTINATTGVITPGSSTPGTYTVTYTIVPAAPCPGFITNQTVTVTAAPSATIAYTPALICNVLETPSTPNPPIPVTHSGTTGGQYSILPLTGLSIDPVTGTLTPSGATPGTYTVKYTIPGANGCTAFVATATITVNGTPNATIVYPGGICMSRAITSVQLTGSQGGSFSAPPGLSINPSTGAITPSTSTPGTYTITYTILPSPPCPGFTTTANVTITPAPSATISYPATSLCNISSSPSSPNPPIPVTFTGTSGGVYSISPSGGLSINSGSGTLTPSGSAPGNYIISYTLPASGGCAAFVATTTVTVSGAPSASISYLGAPYCQGISASQAVNLSGTSGGVFSSAPGLSLNSATGAINPSLSIPGFYTVTYTIAPSVCPGLVTSTSLEITASPVLSFPQPVQSSCSGETVVYTPSSTVANTTYSWSVVGPLPPNVSGVRSGTASGSNPSIFLSFVNTGNISQSLSVQVVPTNPAQNPCAGAPFLLTLTVHPVPSRPSAADTIHFCMGVPATALTASAATGNTIKWYDQNLVPLAVAPVVNTTAPGQFTYYVSQVNSQGCEGTKTKMIVIVHPTPKITSSSFTHPTSCGIPSGFILLHVVDISDQPIPNLPLIVHYTRFQTSFTVSTSTNAAGNVRIALTAGTYSNLFVEIHGCNSQTLPDVFVLKDPTPPVKPVAGYNPPICTGTVLNLTASSPTSSQPGVVNYIWAGPAFGPPGDTVTGSLVSFPSATLDYAGTYVVYAMQNNCISEAASFPVVIKQSPSKPVINATTPLCVGSRLTLQAHSSIVSPDPTLRYIWTGPGAGFPVSSPTAGIASVSVNDAGTYAVSVTSPTTGCSAVTDTLIQIGGYPVIQFATDTITAPTGQILNLSPVLLNAGSSNILPMKKYEWSPMQDAVCSDNVCSSVSATAKNNICYTVKATNIYGCSDTASICIRVFCKGSQVFIPNAFVPNGDLPENRKLIVRGTGVIIRSFKVFNRWGKIVFERNNFAPNSSENGWDGKVNGKPADQGVYVYVVEVICENRTPYFFKGNVTLL